MKKLIERIKAKSSPENRIKGQVSTIIGTACVVALTMGVVTSPLGILALTVGAVLFGGKSAIHAYKTGDEDNEPKGHVLTFDDSISDLEGKPRPNLFQKIADMALSYVGQREISGNKGFLSEEFERELKDVGWYVGAPWCAFFVNLIWKKSGQLTKHLSGSTVLSFKALKNSKEYAITEAPIVGALAYWQTYKNGKPQSTGHVGIVTHVNVDNFETVEGNTTDKGGREGIMVATRIRHYKTNVDDGLRLIGFVNPIEVG